MHDEVTDGHGDVDDVTDEKLLAWAREFIRSLAAGRRPRLRSLKHLPDERHAALAQVVPEALRDRSAAVRQAAAWVAGATDVISDETVPLLRKRLRDRVALVRAAAAWACGEVGEDAASAVPDLIAALGDKDGGVRFAAVWSLGQLGGDASAAVGPLLSLLRSDAPGLLRHAAVRALAEIAPGDPEVQVALTSELEVPSGDRPFFAACGFARAGFAEGAAVVRLLANLNSSDPYMAVVSAWAVGRAAARIEEAVPYLLEALKRWEWLHVAYSEVPGREFVSVRPVLRDALEQTLPGTDDPEYQDFRLKFFLWAFRPSPAPDEGWVREFVWHPWYQRLQRRWFGRRKRPLTPDELEELADLMVEAREAFVRRLAKNPTLGVRPEAYKRLPKFIQNHCRNIAWRLRQRRRRRPPGRKVSGDPEAFGSDKDEPPEDELRASAEIREFVETGLAGEERDVARLRWFVPLSLKATATALGLTVSKVRTRERKAREKAKRRFAASGD